MRDPFGTLVTAGVALAVLSGLYYVGYLMLTTMFQVPRP